MKWMTLARVFLVIFVIIFAAKAVQWSQQNVLSPDIESVAIEGDFVMVSKAALKAQVVEALTAVDDGDQTGQIDRVKQVLQARPGVKSVDVRRAWPSGVLIKYQEWKPLALWNDEAVVLEDLSLLGLDELDDRSALTKLPKINGSEGNHVPAMLAFSSLKQNAPHQKIIDFTENGVTGGRVKFENGVTVNLGMTDFDRRLYRMKKLISADEFWAALQNGAVVDLRYNEGFSVSQPDAADKG